jgi:hypothetical protein
MVKINVLDMSINRQEMFKCFLNENSQLLFFNAQRSEEELIGKHFDCFGGQTVLALIRTIITWRLQTKL